MQFSNKTLLMVAGAIVVLGLTGFLTWYFVPDYRLQGSILLWASLFAINYLLFWLFWRFVRKFVQWPAWKLLTGLLCLFLSSFALIFFRRDLGLESAALFLFPVLSCFPLLAEEMVLLVQGLLRGVRSPKPQPSRSSSAGSDAHSDNPWGEGSIPTLKGDLVQSHGEKKIADFLHAHRIDYEYDQRLTIGGEWVRPDFYLTGAGIIIEYWGMKGESGYDKKMKEKKTLYMENGQKFVSIGREDIKNLDEVLKNKLTRLGVVFEK